MITLRGVDATQSLADREAFQHHLPTVPQGAVVLATCDRIEVYEGEGDPEPRVARHLFRVVSGLDSPLLGECQIQGQVRQAYAAAPGPLDRGLHRLFQQALRVGKRVRSETGLSRGALGHSQIVADLVGHLPVPLAELRLLVIGVNNLNRGILRYLARRGSRTVFLGNRTLDRAQTLVRELGVGEALPLDRIRSVLAEVDVVISATSAPHLIVHAHDLPTTGGPRWFYDLAVPRDIDPAIGLVPGKTLYNVSDLEQAAARSLGHRQAEVARAEAILEEELERLWGRHAGVTP